MAQEVMFFSKDSTPPPHTVPAVDDYSLDVYASYADSFDLSLLSSDITLCPHPQLFLQQQYQQQQCNSNLLSPPSQMAGQQQMKQEKCWNDLMQQQQQQTTGTLSVLQEQLRSGPQYQYYTNASPQHQHSEPFITIFPPSPCPSLDTQVSSNTSVNCLSSSSNSSANFAEIKQEFSFLPPSPPESTNGGSPSPYIDIKIEPETESCIDIDSLLSESFEDYTTKKIQVASSSASSTSSSSMGQQTTSMGDASAAAVGQDYQLLREYLQDTSFQRKHNLKPLALESLFGGWTSRGDIEPVISLALEHAKRDVQETCAALDISQDPQKWTQKHVQAWLQSTLSQFKLPLIEDMETVFSEDGETLFQLSEEEFIQRSPQAGSTLHAQLEVWKAACYDVSQQLYASLNTATPTPTTLWSPADSHCSDSHSEDEDEEMPLVVAEISKALQQKKSSAIDIKIESEVPSLNGAALTSATAVTSSNAPTASPPAASVSTAAATTATATSTASASTSTATPTASPKVPRQGGSHIHLWQFLKELLATPQTHGSAIRWLDRTKGVFKIEDSVRVARLWGRRKNRPAMNYDKLSRSIRQYYKKGIMKKTERSQRLVYQFCHPYCL